MFVVVCGVFLVCCLSSVVVCGSLSFVVFCFLRAVCSCGLLVVGRGMLCCVFVVACCLLLFLVCCVCCL